MSEVVTQDRYSVDECGIFKMPCLTNIRQRDHHDCLGGSSSSLFRYPHFENTSIRLQTFELWPVALQPRPRALAEAGFFYTGEGDKCVCFSCGNGLRDWKVTDDPWIEHRKHFPKCQFVVKEANKQRIPKKEVSTEVIKPTVTAIAEALLCKVCFLRQMCMTFLPCKHVSCCESCASRFKQCPICRETIASSFKVYLQ